MSWRRPTYHMFQRRRKLVGVEGTAFFPHLRPRNDNLVPRFHYNHAIKQQCLLLRQDKKQRIQ